MRRLIQIFYICMWVFSCEVIASTNPLEYKTYSPKQRNLIHVLTINPQQTNLIAIRAQDIGHGLDTVENMAKHMGAVAGINGGFFRLNVADANNAVPAGVLKINNHWHGIAYKPRGAIGWDPKNCTVLFDIIQTDSQILFNERVMPVNAMNKLLIGNQAVLLSDSYNSHIKVENNLALLLLDQRIQSIHSIGNVVVPADGYVYTVGGALRAQAAQLKPGDAAVVNIRISPQLAPHKIKQWNRLPYVVGGGPLLISNGQKIHDFAMERMREDFINARYARTAIGILPDKRLVLVVAQQGLLQDTVGLSIAELRDFMYSLGCVYALNLDGGGSSAMYIENIKHGTITEHPVTDAILILRR